MSFDHIVDHVYSTHKGRTPSWTVRPRRVGGREYRRRRLVLGGLLLVVVGIVAFVGFQIYQTRQDGGEAVNNLPYAEKVGEGAWAIHNTEPVRQTLTSVASDKVDTNLVENKEAVQQVRKNAERSAEKRGTSPEVYRWEVTLPSGTVFSFGLQEPEGIKPVVKVQDREGWFVRYYSSSSVILSEAKDLKDSSPIWAQNDMKHVQPKVEKNVITWEISEGITARYTMMEDRVKADYIVDSPEALCSSSSEASAQSRSVNTSSSRLDSPESRSNNNCNMLDFIIETNSGDSQRSSLSEEAFVKSVQSGRGNATLTSMPDESLALFNDLDQEIFMIPSPEVFDKNNNSLPNTKYQLLNTETKGISTLSIVLSEEEIAQATFPLTIDPVVIDSSTLTTGTAYANGRRLLRDPWGNLIAFIADSGSTGRIYVKNYSSTSWTDLSPSLFKPLDKPGGVDIDSLGNLHWVDHASGGNVNYKYYAITRGGDNTISSIANGVQFNIDTSGVGTRPSLIIANKGGGAGVEKVVVAWAMNTTSGGTVIGQIRLLQCDVADDCTTGANWKDASEEQTGSGSCTNGITGVGIPNAVDCSGASDPLLTYGGAHTTHHGVLTQIPGRPKRSPTSAKKFESSTYTNLTNALDNSTGTTADISTIGFDEYIYVGDDQKFSKITFDVTNINTSIQGNTIEEYCSVVDGSNACTTWTTLSNFIDNTDPGTPRSLNEDGSILFDEPSDWVQSSVDGVLTYWVRLRPNTDDDVTLAEIYVTDRNARALLAVGGVDATNDLGVAYIPWDEVAGDRWENRPDQAGSGWREASTTLSTTGFEPTTFTNYVLSATTDYINNLTYVVYIEGTAVGSSNITIKSVQNNKDLTIAGNWTDASFPATTEAGDTVLSLTSDGQDIYLFYVLDPGTNGLVWRKCQPYVAGVATVCDSASDWGSENTLSAFASGTEVPTHPQAVVTKVSGDTIAIDVVYVNDLGTDQVKYERHYVDNRYAQYRTAAQGDDGGQNDCDTLGTDDQNIGDVQLYIGAETSVGGCGSSAGKYHVGLRFQGVNITPGTKVASAYLDIWVDTDNGTGAVNDFTIYGEDADNSSAYTNLTNCTPESTCTGIVNERTRTTASVDHAIDFMTVRYRFDVTDIVQEIVCRGAGEVQPCVGDNFSSGSWQAHNALSLLLISTESTAATNYITFRTADGGSAIALNPTLQINLGNSSYDYSMGAATKLPTGSGSYTNLDHPMATSSGELEAVLGMNDNHYASISATTNYASSSAVPAFMFKVYNPTDDVSARPRPSLVARSTESPSARPVYLQVYRGGSTNNWVTVDSDSSSSAEMDIVLHPEALASDLTDYYFANAPNGSCTGGTYTDCWTYWRVYQDAPGSEFDETLSVDYFTVDYLTGPTQIVFTTPERGLTQSVCSGSGKPFTMQLQDEIGVAAVPNETTVVRVTSDSTGEAVYSDDTCSTVVTDGDFTFTTAQSSKTFYVQDSEIGSYVLTAERQSGDTLTSDTQYYVVSLSAGPEDVKIQGGTDIRGGTAFQ